MKISIVIPNWNGGEKLKKHLPQIIKLASDRKDTEIIVSDDASSDNSVEIIKQQFPEVVLVERNKNGGFSSNVNTGVNQATGELIVLLNNDAEIKNEALDYALPHFKNSQVFSVGFNAGGGWAYGEFKDGFFWHHQAPTETVDKQKAHQTLWSSGGGCVFKKSIWEELGGLDTLFDPFYEEDVDLGYRATKRGFLNLWEPKSLIEHYQEKGVIAANFSKKKVAQIAQRNQLIFIWKNITSKKLMSQHHKVLFKMLFQHPKYWRTFLAAAKNYREIMYKRSLEKKQAKLTDEEIFRIFHQV